MHFDWLKVWKASASVLLKKLQFSQNSAKLFKLRLTKKSFQHLRSRTLSLKVIASEEVNLDRDLFLNLGRVQNLSLDVSGNLPIPSLPMVIETSPGELGSGEDPSKQVVRPTLETLRDEFPRVLGNPATTYGPNRPRAVFLSHLDISNAAWICSCDGVG